MFPFVLALMGFGFVLVPLSQGELFFYWDNAQQHFPLTQYLHDALRAGVIPQWWPDVGLGFPTMAESTSAHYHPLRLFLAYALQPHIAFMLEIGFYLSISGISMFFFLREYRLHRLSCLLGGICQMFGSFSIVSLNNMAIHRSLCLLPLAMLIAEKYAKAMTIHLLLLGSLIFGLQLLAGYPSPTIVTMVATTVFILFRVWQRSWHDHASLRTAACVIGQKVFLWGLVIVFGFGIAAIQVIPTLLHVSHSLRDGGLDFEYAVVSSLPAKIKYLPQLIFPYVYQQGDFLPKIAWWGSYFNEVPYMGIYIGALPVVLGAMALWWVRPWPDPSWSLLACSIVSVAFALGAVTPLYPALWSLPGLHGMRFPYRFLMWTSFCLAALAALGLHRLLARSRLAPWTTKDGIPFLGVGTGVIVLAGFFFINKSVLASTAHYANDMGSGIVKSLVLFSFSLMMVWAVVHFRKSQRIVLPLFVVAVVCDLWIFQISSGYVPTVPLRKIIDPPPIAKFLKTDRERFRVMTLVSVEKVRNKLEDLFGLLQADTATIWGIETADVWAALTPKRYYAVHEGILWELANSPENVGKISPFIGSMNVKYLIAPTGMTVPGWKHVYQTSQANVLKNEFFLPRAFLVGHVVQEDIIVDPKRFYKSTYLRLGGYFGMVANWWLRREDAQVLDNILERQVNYRTTAVVAGKNFPELSGIDPEATVRFVEQEFDQMNIVAETKTPGFLVVSNNYYPGWSAMLNGRPVRIHRANYVGMGVFLPEGHSEVTFHFVAPGFWAGLGITIVSTLMWGIAWLRRGTVNVPFSKPYLFVRRSFKKDRGLIRHGE